MALLRAEDGRTFECETHAFVGRGVLNGVSFDKVDGLDREISSMHAAITWNTKNQKWEIRDLGSQNGTFVDGRRVEPGEASPIFVGATLVFGRLQVTMIDDAPPTGHAVCPGSGEVRFCRSGVLLLPDERAPEIAVVRRHQGWYSLPASELARSGEDDTEALEALDPVSEVSAGGRTWRIRTPTQRGQTVGRQHRLDDYTVVLEIRDAGEKINMVLEHGQSVIDLPHRAHCEMLWVLARHRLADVEAKLPLPEQGWMTQEQVIKGINSEAKEPIAHLNIQIMRARRQLEPHAPEDFMELVQRHPTRTGVLRVGTDRLRIVDYTR